jgi:hypothetical protein
MFESTDDSLDKKYLVQLEFWFGYVIATIDGIPEGEPMIFDTNEEATQFGLSEGVNFIVSQAIMNGADE